VQVAGIEDIFLGFFGNLFNVLFAVVFLLTGIIVGFLFRPRGGNTVMKILPKDRRFVDFKIAEETAVSVECEDKKGYPPHRFLKIAQGFYGTTGRFVRRTSTRYLGKEGTAYLWLTDQDRLKRVDGGLPAYLKTLWGDGPYDEMPDDLKVKCDDSKVLVTVDLADGLTPEDMRPISEENIKTEEDRKAAQLFFEGKKKEERHAWVNLILAGAAGFGVACALVLIGIIKAPAGETKIVIAPTNSTG